MATKHITALRSFLIGAFQYWGKLHPGLDKYTVHEGAPVSKNQLLVSDKEGRQFVISINAIRIPRVALTK